MSTRKVARRKAPPAAREERATSSEVGRKGAESAKKAAEAQDAFGDHEIARAWLRAENIGLGGCTPLSMLDTDIGSREVEKILVAIAHGGVA